MKDTDHYGDLFLCGTEVEGSCQSVNQSPNTSKCLMAYLLDGKIRLVAVTDEQGQIVARCIIRLLWESDTKKPVLLMEKVYFRGEPNQEYEKVIHDMCRSRAKKLGVPLLSVDNRGKPYRGRVEIRQTRTPYEYVDSNRGILKNGRGTIISQPTFEHSL